MHQFVFLNGPPGAGKDTVVSQLVPYLSFVHMKFAAPIKRMAAALLDINQGQLETAKELKHSMLKRADFGPSTDTVRELLIALSEDFLKPRYGDQFFGRAFSHYARGIATPLIIASDCGFDSEVQRVADDHGRKNCAIIRITRPNHSFTGDSRNYVHGIGCANYGVVNDGSIHDLTMRVLRVIIKQFNPPLLREPDWIK